MESAMRYSEPPTREACLEQIALLVESDLLRNSDVLLKVLEYLAKHTLDSPTTHVKEYEIGIDALGYDATFDTQSNSAVRVQVSRLRSKLLEYYGSAGAHDPIVVDVPKGGYRLFFKWRDAVTVQETPQEPDSEDAVEPPIRSRSFLERLRPYSVHFLSALLVASLIALCVESISLRHLQSQISPWKDQPTLKEFWSNFYGQNEDTDLVLADDSFLIFQFVAQHTYSLNSYIDHSFLKAETTPQLSDNIRQTLNTLAGKNLGNSDEFQIALRLYVLNPPEGRLHFYNAREYSATNLDQHNAILIGSPIANPWTAIFNNQMAFTSEARTVGSSIAMSIVNHAPAKGEQSVYVPLYDQQNGMQEGHCIVALLPSPGHNKKVLLIEGTTSEANEAAANLLLSETELVKLKQRMHVTKFPYFEILLKTSQVRSVPLTYTVEAYRTYQDLP
jgi:hypothetical protein